MGNLQEEFRTLEKLAQKFSARAKIRKRILGMDIQQAIRRIFKNIDLLNPVLETNQRSILLQAGCAIILQEDWDKLPIVIDYLKSALQLLENSDGMNITKDSKTRFPIGIQSVIIENYHYVKSVAITIPSNASFIVLTGNNAEGKTSLLQAIASHFDSLMESNLIGQLIKGNDIIFLKMYHQQESLSSITVGSKILLMNHYILGNYLIAYGASRLQLQSSESQDVKKLKKSNTYNLFHNESTLLNIEHWFKIQKLKQDGERIQAVKNLLIELMPTIQDIQMGVKKTQLSDYAITYIENGKELLSEELSAGNKSILAMIGDMLIRLYDAQPEIIEPSQLIGIVLIDELELHLHPTWQKKMPQLLVKHFPLVQFIVSTHSPIVFLGMPPDTVLFNISKDETGETVIQKINIDLANVLPNQILTSSLFGMDDIRNIYNKSIQELSVETEPEIKKRKAAEEQLKKVSQNFTFKLPSNDKN